MSISDIHDDGLALTGERTLPGIPDESYWFERHVVAYNLAAGRVAGRVVLDAGCGEGYGLEHLAGAGARRVIGVDLEPAVVAHVERTYAARDGRIEALASELTELPLRDDEVDVTVSFQVLEHVHDVPAYLASLRRVTRPGGEVVLATPNRLTFTPGSDVPVNPFHTREFTAGELEDELMLADLDLVQLLGVHHGPMLSFLDRLAGGSLPHRLGQGPPESWPRWLRGMVHRVHASWFDLRSDDLDTSLDLIAICRVPRP